MARRSESTYRLTGDEGRMYGLTRTSSVLADRPVRRDVEPRLQEAPQALHVDGTVGVPALGRAGSRHRALAVGTRTARRCGR
jgi:hypothetical protein